MAGKSKSKAKAKSTNSGAAAAAKEPAAAPAPSAGGGGGGLPDVHHQNGVVEVANGEAKGSIEANGNAPAAVNSDSSDAAAATRKQSEGEFSLYPVPVKLQSGEKLELQLSPGDTVMDVRHFLLDSPETCFITCYDLMLHTKDGSVHQLEDYSEISEVGDITTGGCSLEMVPAFYDERSVRVNLRRTRELLSLSSLHVSLSSSLAFQQDAAQAKTADVGKVVVNELDNMNYLSDVTNSLQNLFAPTPKEIKCLESLVFSAFNPPPRHRRLFGDLIYIDVITLEGKSFCITGSTSSFYVNSSSGNLFDPAPSKYPNDSNTLVGLLQKISSKFKKAFQEILSRKALVHPFEAVQTLLPPAPWLGLHPVPNHVRDAARAEDALPLTFGSEQIGMQRDWNEELQSCRDFPHDTPQEKILRARALYKVTCDFVDAAVKGAIGVISGCILPINPTDPECFHMYVHNNIFFSFSVDSEIEQMMKDVKANSRKTPCGSKHAQSLHNYGKSEVEKIMDSANSNGCNTVPDNPSDAPSEGQFDTEQATYGSANNDLKGTKAYQEADVPQLYNLAMAIIDYRGYRVVAQSIIPGILQGDKSDCLLYGSVDSGKKINCNEGFHSKVVEAAKRLHLKEHIVLDGSGNAVKLAAPVECKGIVGSDNRQYLLDLMRVTPRDSNYMESHHRFCVLRPELVGSFCEAEAAKLSSSQGAGNASKGGDHKSIDCVDGMVAAAEEHQKGYKVSDVNVTESENSSQLESSSKTDEQFSASSEITFNPNVFTEFKLAGTQEEIAEDEALVRKAGSYLLDVVIPKFVQELSALEVSPMDGQTLTDALHNSGINVRYIGKIANAVKDLPHMWDLLSAEVFVRSAKHVLKEVLRECEDHDVGAAITHFLNCSFGEVSSSSIISGTKDERSKPFLKPLKNRWNGGKFFNKGFSSYLELTSDETWSCIKEFARFKYEFEVPDDARIKVKQISILRNLCQKVGITVAARKYDFGVSTPFHTSDVLDLVPVVKHSVPVCTDARNLMEAGKALMSEGTLNEAYMLFSEAFALLQQITGPMHRDVALCCRYLAMVLYHAGDTSGAIVQQHRELIINERCLGLDHPDTAHSYGNMALFYHSLNNPELALRHMSRTLLLLSLASGTDHPDVAATLINVAMMYQDSGKMDIALRYHQEALKMNERLLGPEHVQTAICYHALAVAFNCMGAFKLSIQHEKKAYDILVKQLGEEDLRTKDAENWLKTFKLREQQVNAQKQKGIGGNAASTLNAINILKANPGLLQAFEVAALESGNGTSGVNRSLNAAVVGEGFPRGRGVDERAARTAAEIRKRAAARGLNLRQNSSPLSSQYLTRLINLVNTADASAESTKAPPAEPGTAAVNGSITNGTSVEQAAKESNGAVVNSGGSAPLGLGASLGTLGQRKHKNKQGSSAQ